MLEELIKELIKLKNEYGDMPVQLIVPDGESDTCGSCIYCIDIDGDEGHNYMNLVADYIPKHIKDKYFNEAEYYVK